MGALEVIGLTAQKRKRLVIELASAVNTPGLQFQLGKIIEALGGVGSVIDLLGESERFAVSFFGGRKIALLVAHVADVDPPLHLPALEPNCGGGLLGLLEIIESAFEVSQHVVAPAEISQDG
jgi:hypothetical protein